MGHTIQYTPVQERSHAVSGTSERPIPAASETGRNGQEQMASDSDCHSDCHDDGACRVQDAHTSLPLWSRPAMRSVADGIFRPGGLALTDRIAMLAGVLPGWRIADIGCGQGASVLHLRQRYGACAVGMDASIAQITTCNNAMPQSGALPLVMGNATHPPFRSGSFKMVLCECVLSLLPDTRAALRSFRDLLVPGGVLAVTDLYMRGECGADMAFAQGSCLGWGATHKAITAHLHSSGFTMRLFEDHSKELGELAAKLIFAGESPCLLSPTPTVATDKIRTSAARSLRLDADKTDCISNDTASLTGCCAKKHSRTGKPGPGYFLLLADRVP